MICLSFGIGLNEAKEVIVPGPVHGAITVAFILLAVFVGMKGIQYVAKVATYVPLIFVAILVILAGEDGRRSGQFLARQALARRPARPWQPPQHVPGRRCRGRQGGRRGSRRKSKPPVLAGAAKTVDRAGRSSCSFATYVVGFFATAGAAGADFGMNNRNAIRRATRAAWWASSEPRCWPADWPCSSWPAPMAPRTWCPPTRSANSTRSNSLR